MKKNKSSVFIGSSAEGLKIAKHLQVLLDHSCEVTIWSQGVFGLNKGSLEALVNALDGFDFAILVLTADDLVTSRDVSTAAPRDNVLFELGLFMGGLGKNRTFIVYDRSKSLKLPSDLAGVTAATFELHSNGNLQSSLGASATLIENEIESQGPRERTSIKQLSQATDNLDTVLNQMQVLLKLLSRSRKVELDIISTQFGPLISPQKLKQLQKDLESLDKVLAVQEDS